MRCSRERREMKDIFRTHDEEEKKKFSNEGIGPFGQSTGGCFGLMAVCTALCLNPLLKLFEVFVAQEILSEERVCLEERV